ncbi:MAG: response regulator [Chthoniobacterales bacterium]|nr:response regulator [Chthoniobacterales bacterium]
MKTDNDDRLRQELRLAQLEIKVLREQLLKSVQEAQRVRDEIEELAGELKPARPEPSVIVPMVTPPPAPARAPANGHPLGSKPRILYVEDSEPNYRLMENVLRDRPGAELVWAETGEKGLAMAGEKTPQLVLLDLDLPDIHGSKVLERLQAKPETAHTPVIVISADATPSQIERMLTAGARNYLTKPFEIRRFLCMFDEIFAPA